MVEGSTYTLCVNYYAGGQVVSSLDGTCGPGQVAVETVSETPLVFCIHPYTGNVLFSLTQTCAPPRFAHVVPDNGDLLTCLHVFTGKHRRVFSHAQCGPYELPNTVFAAA